MNKIVGGPKYTVLEVIAANLAATFYEAARNTGMASKKHKNARSYGRANIELYIPKAIEIAIEMLGRDDVSIHMKDELSNAIIERANDAHSHAIVQQSLHQKVDISGMPAFNEDAGEGPIKPVVINTNPTVLHNRPPLILKG